MSLASNLAKLNNAELILDTTASLTTFILSIPISINADEQHTEEKEQEEDSESTTFIEQNTPPTVISDTEEYEELGEDEPKIKENSILIVEDESLKREIH